MLWKSNDSAVLILTYASLGKTVGNLQRLIALRLFCTKTQLFCSTLEA